VPCGLSSRQKVQEPGQVPVPVRVRVRVRVPVPVQEPEPEQVPEQVLVLVLVLVQEQEQEQVPEQVLVQMQEPEPVKALEPGPEPVQAGCPLMRYWGWCPPPRRCRHRRRRRPSTKELRAQKRRWFGTASCSVVRSFSSLRNLQDVAQTPRNRFLKLLAFCLMRIWSVHL
jgi:hypothetical protein